MEYTHFMYVLEQFMCQGAKYGVKRDFYTLL